MLPKVQCKERVGSTWDKETRQGRYLLAVEAHGCRGRDGDSVVTVVHQGQAI